MSALVVTIVLISLFFSDTIKIKFYRYLHQYWYDNLPVDIKTQLDTTQSQCAAISQPIADIYKTYWGSDYEAVQNWILYSINLTVILIGLIAAIFFSKKLSKPVSIVAKAARNVTRGNLGARASQSSSLSGNEIGTLVSDFNSMAESLERRERERQKSMAAIAHELRTPLTILKGRLQGMADGIYRPDPSEIDRLIGQTDLLGRIVDDIRVLSLAEVGELIFEMHDLQLDEVVSDVARSMAPVCKNQEIFLELDLQSAPVKGDRARVTQIVCNLLDNAIQYGADGKWIRLETGSSGDMSFVRVLDNGNGLPDDIAALFEYFERGEKSRSRQTGGSGLGLAVVKSLVEVHHGTVSARNRKQGGAVFEVLIPKQS